MDATGNRRGVLIASNVPMNPRASYRLDLTSGCGVDINAGGGRQHITLDSRLDPGSFYFEVGNYAKSAQGGSKVTYFELDRR
ncbi:hypothetical protein SAMN05216359_102543 [Roseateles sp. YR242]|uniref:polysaccharide lyase family 7 protein n=1 Tax=Roseateles sp. YR242 TaxID=1855305 RepID=UPI0008D1415D|nr:polysaccharide lyase family 7 protein [Roseateles sp. YR242]SEK64977.1 hypothetical protein SAMN05216359_102543 [Roseateles sp. YR242]